MTLVDELIILLNSVNCYAMVSLVSVSPQIYKYGYLSNEKCTVFMYSHSTSDNIQTNIEKRESELTVTCLSVSFQSLLPTNERLQVPTLPEVFKPVQSTIDIQRFKLQTITAS